jgi:GT2 family glycosyltransferase
MLASVAFARRKPPIRAAARCNCATKVLTHEISSPKSDRLLALPDPEKRKVLDFGRNPLHTSYVSLSISVSAGMTVEDIGVVIIGRNEGERLVRCLTSVKACVRNVIYVDSGSTDGSVSFASRIGAHVINLDLTQPFSAARARNEGYSALKSLKPDTRFIQFIDGDCSLASKWLETAHTFIAQRSDIAIVCGRRRERHPEASIYNYLCDLEWDTPIGEASACGGDALMRAEAFEAVGGFRSDVMAGEEPELCLRLRDIGWKIWRLDAEMTEHDAAMTRFRQWWFRSVRTGYGLADIYWLHRDSPERIWKRMMFRMLVWGGLLPIGIGVGALLRPPALLGASVYLVQICRMALREGPNSHRPWLRALLLTLSKFAEFQGFLKFLLRKRKMGAAKLIEYK